jgi:hypothetical protein
MNRTTSIIPRRTGWKISRTETYGKTAQIGRQYQEESLVLNVRGWRKVAGDRDVWRRTIGEVMA